MRKEEIEILIYFNSLKLIKMSHVRKTISGKNVELFRRTLNGKLLPSRNNVNFFKPPKIDDISIYHKIESSWVINNFNTTYIHSIKPDYKWKKGIMRKLEAGTYIFYKKQPEIVLQAYIPIGDCISIIYYDDGRENFSLQRGDFVVHPQPDCTMIIAHKDMNLFIFDYIPQDVLNENSDDNMEYHIAVAMTMKNYAINCANASSSSSRSSVLISSP